MYGISLRNLDGCPSPAPGRVAMSISIVEYLMSLSLLFTYCWLTTEKFVKHAPKEEEEAEAEGKAGKEEWRCVRS